MNVFPEPNSGSGEEEADSPATVKLGDFVQWTSNGTQAVDRTTSENEHRRRNFEANEVRIPGGDQGFGGRAAQEKNTILSQFTL
jgi:hypothetical protein